MVQGGWLIIPRWHGLGSCGWHPWGSGMVRIHAVLMHRCHRSAQSVLALLCGADYMVATIHCVVAMVTIWRRIWLRFWRAIREGGVHKPVIITLLNAVDGIVDSCATIQSVHWALCLSVGRGGVGGMGVSQVVELVALVQLLRWKTGVVLWGDGSSVVRVRYGGNGFLGEAPPL